MCLSNVTVCPRVSASFHVHTCNGSITLASPPYPFPCLDKVLLRWSLQKGFVPLPKSSNPSRIAENAALFDFELDAATMAAVDGLEERFMATKMSTMFDQLTPY